MISLHSPFFRLISKDCSIRSASGRSGCRTRHPNYRAASEVNSRNKAKSESSSQAICSTLQKLQLISNITQFASRPFTQSIWSQSQLMSLPLSDKLVTQCARVNCPCPSCSVQLFLSLDSFSPTAGLIPDGERSSAVKPIKCWISPFMSVPAHTDGQIRALVLTAAFWR